MSRISLKYFVALILGLFFIVGCSQKYQVSKPTEMMTESVFLKKAESKATPFGKKILQKAREMSIEKGVIIRGSCWDYINAVYNRAGFTQKRRKIVFKGKKEVLSSI